MSLAFERQIDSIQATHRISGTDVATRPLFYPDRPHPSKCGNIIPPPSWYRKLDCSVYNVGLADGFLYQSYTRRRHAEGGIEVPSTVADYVYPISAYDHPLVRKASEGYDIDSWLTLVSHAPTISSLLDMYTGYPKSTTINIKQSNPKMNPYQYKKTIEFRQHRATLQAEAVVSWLQYVVAMVGFCESNSMAALLALVNRNSRTRRADFDFPMLCRTIGCGDDVVAHYKNQLAGDYSHTLRQQDKVDADQTARTRAEPLAELALHSISRERDDINPKHVHKRLREKLLMGGYGQFSREYIDEVLGSAHVSEQEREKITLGYRAPVHVADYVQPTLSTYDSEYEGSSGDDPYERLRDTVAAAFIDEPRGRTGPAAGRRYGTPPPEVLPGPSEQMAAHQMGRSHSPRVDIDLQWRSPSTALSTSSRRTSNSSRSRSKARSQ